MKTNKKYIISVAAAVLAVTAVCFGQRLIITPPTIVVSAPPPVVVAPAVVVAPDYYAWDGYEYVGIVGDQYYYLGPGNVWMVMDAPRLHRFQDWQHGHPDWRSHATHNVLYRNMGRSGGQPHAMPDRSPAHGQPMMAPQHDQPMHAQPDHAQPQHVAPPTQPEHAQPQHEQPMQGQPDHGQSQHSPPQ